MGVCDRYPSFFYESCGLRVAFFMLPHPEEIRDMHLLHIPLFLCSCLLIAHARGYPEGGGDGRKDGDGDVEDLAPDFFVHSF